jgi:hypothetical protein
MKTENEKYKKVLNLLRNSKPELDSTDDIEKVVIKRIAKINLSVLSLSEVIDFLFGWVYIGWVRRTLITASVALIIIFIYQQGIILKRIDLLSRQIVVTDKENLFSRTDEIEKLLTVFRNSGKRFPSKTITISESQMNELLESLKELQIKYKDLENLIEGDPELKNLIRKKLIENNNNNINL